MGPRSRNRALGVVVLGDGAIGLMFVAVVAQSAEVLFGGNDQRLQIGKHLGAAFKYHQLEDMPAVVRNRQRVGVQMW